MHIKRNCIYSHSNEIEELLLSDIFSKPWIVTQNNDLTVSLCFFSLEQKLPFYFSLFVPLPGSPTAWHSCHVPFSFLLLIFPPLNYLSKPPCALLPICSIHSLSLYSHPCPSDSLAFCSSFTLRHRHSLLLSKLQTSLFFAAARLALLHFCVSPEVFLLPSCASTSPPPPPCTCLSSLSYSLMQEKLGTFLCCHFIILGKFTPVFPTYCLCNHQLQVWEFSV